MGEIRVLSDKVANQIAAGEVVERPVAVIKELVENSIDAGAKRIEVEYRNGGKAYMRIQDDGCGMSPQDALLCLERHATSKIREMTDLDHIASFGFRGEAIPSIASVSRFTLKTRREEDPHGTEILVDGGKLVHKRECGTPSGTCIEVSQLFNSVPARRKFLKTEATESAHITHAIKVFSIAHPGIQFVLIENGRTIFQSPAVKHLKDRIRMIWGRKLASDLLSLNNESEDLKIRGLMSPPGSSVATRTHLFCFVNGRAIESRTLVQAIREAYATYLPSGRFPKAFLFLDIDPRAVDVNVHPSKKEVRFREEAKVRHFIITAVLEVLKAQQSSHREAIAAPTPVAAIPTPALTPSTAPTPAFTPSAPPLAQVAPVQEAAPLLAPEPVKAAPAFQKSTWRYIGLYQTDCGLFETNAGLVVLNARRAYQRVLFEQTQRQVKNNSVPSQKLLIPTPFELSPIEAPAFEKAIELLNQNGFEIELFGRNFYRIQALPAWMDAEKAAEIVQDIAAYLHRGHASLESLIEKYLLERASSHPSPKGPMSQAAIVALQEELMQCDEPLTCPKGHPTFFEIPARELSQRFGL